MDHPVAITGLGAVTAQGIGVPATWAGLLRDPGDRDMIRSWTPLREESNGGDGARPGHDHPLSKIKVAQCPDLPNPSDLPHRLWHKLSRTQQLACLAVDEALAQAHLEPKKYPATPIALFMATTVCGMDRNERYYQQYRQNPHTADPDLMRRIQPHEVAALLRRRHNIAPVGLNRVCLTTCVGSAMAIGAACDAIALGECDIAIAGGSEALCRVVLSGFHALKVVAPDGCRPFDKDRPGITVGEGAGVLILESIPHAKKRGVTPLAYLRGFGVTCDAHHITAPDPEGRQAARAMRDAIQRAGLTPHDIHYINAHGTGTRDNDAMESRAIRTVFANLQTPPLVSSTKRRTGHTFGAAGALEAIICVQAIRERIVPANAGSVDPDPALDLPIVRGESRHAEIQAAMSTNFAFGGNNTALVFSRDPGENT